ncbi:MAG: DegT/DnrJ/EryC1/StrS family aminotransferase [Bacteroidia bacterium]|nr:DegT/DnrJ/EryC1/StrS family aminotransferase [Bacteroidia bacterium]
MLPFSPPHIHQDIIDEVVATLRSGWITTGPRTKQFEKDLTAYCGNKATICLNSATAGLEIMLRWFGVGPGDEVIVPAYTYSATANVVMHCGATPVFCDVNPDDFNINPEEIRKKITAKTKVVMPVDFAGFPCDYHAINALVASAEIKALFAANNEQQKQLGRILILADAAHSIGAMMNGMRTGSLTDVSVFSFHAVKNLTTAEGGAVALNLPAPFDNEAVYKYLCIATLHGQNKDALAKMQKGNWRYDIIEPGYKCNMTDIMAAIGLVELRRYESEILPKRKQITAWYNELLGQTQWAQLPVSNTANRTSSWHLYPLRIRGIDEATRDRIMQDIFDRDVSVNMHFIPLPLLKFYHEQGYRMEDYPQAYANYACEISLPLYEDLSREQVEQVAQAVIRAVELNARPGIPKI